MAAARTLGGIICIVVGGLLVSACGGPQSDRQLAQSLLLKASDVPSGWTTSSIPSLSLFTVNRRVSTCLGIPDPYKKGGIIAHSPVHADFGDTYAASSVAIVFQSVSGVRALLHEVRLPQYPTCAAAAIRAQAVANTRGRGVTVKPVSVSVGSAPPGVTLPGAVTATEVTTVSQGTVSTAEKGVVAFIPHGRVVVEVVVGEVSGAGYVNFFHSLCSTLTRRLLAAQQ